MEKVEKKTQKRAIEIPDPVDDALLTLADAEVKKKKERKVIIS